MLLGIDVGGTFTDAVLIDGDVICSMAKSETTPDILGGILLSLDRLFSAEKLDKEIIDAEKMRITRVVISSTIVTNALVENKIDQVFLAVMAGPGMSTKGQFPVEPYLATGYIDHRGKVITAEAIDYDLVKKMATGKKVAAVSGKFSVRNQINEKALRGDLKKCNFLKIFSGSELSGELNFIRRTNSAYFSAAVYTKYADFIRQIKKSLNEREINAPVHILKADGGTLPLEASLEQPVEAVFTGPAASVLGIEALKPPSVNTISLDVGGTTTDIAFWEKGQPLMSPKGAVLAGFNTAVRAFHMRSLGLGGDSVIIRTKEGFVVGPERAGRAMALGGRAPTLSDAFITLGLVSFGEGRLAREAMKLYARGEETEKQVAHAVVEAAVKKIKRTIDEMVYQWGIQPVYTVNDIIAGNLFKPELLIGVGGAAPGLVKALGDYMHLPVEIPVGAMVANAIGAALAKPTLTATLRADTTENYYIIPEAGIKAKLPHYFNKQVAQELLTAWLQAAANKWQIIAPVAEIVAYEEFATIHDYISSGKIIYLKMQLQPGVLSHVIGREVAF
ncbi:MAG: hydantoinase/oxoprolinase family protein [Acidaminococcaceae bacterium]|nr:hydantoinase/oxoprolinase family protein [Acidaminococcaceae bacterium]MDD4722079.1 hydantoinase/oxoprolinase family protein [Acidaminococcaceae bacterium]